MNPKKKGSFMGHGHIFHFFFLLFTLLGHCFCKMKLLKRKGSMMIILATFYEWSSFWTQFYLLETNNFHVSNNNNKPFSTS